MNRNGAAIKGNAALRIETTGPVNRHSKSAAMRRRVRAQGIQAMPSQSDVTGKGHTAAPAQQMTCQGESGTKAVTARRIRAFSGEERIKPQHSSDRSRGLAGTDVQKQRGTHVL
jgi:hypothetical protein